MFRTLLIFVGLVVLLGGGVAIAAWPHAAEASRNGFLTPAQLKSAYVRVRPGVTPASQLARLGFDTNAAVKLSYLGVIEQFMPKDSFGFDALDPALQNCFQAGDRCAAYIFRLPDNRPGKVVLLIEGGRVSYKTISGIASAYNKPALLRAASLD